MPPIGKAIHNAKEPNRGDRVADADGAKNGIFGVQRGLGALSSARSRLDSMQAARHDTRAGMVMRRSAAVAWSTGTEYESEADLRGKLSTISIL